MTAENSQTSQPLPPIEQPRARYTTFYRTMLILSTIGTALSAFGLIELPKTLGYLPNHTAYAVVWMVSMLLVYPVSITALVLLWRKQIVGLWLKIASYAASIMLSIVSMLVATGVLQEEVKAALASAESQALPRSVMEGIITGTYYTGMIFGIFVSIVFALLWVFAWRSQRRADNDED